VLADACFVNMYHISYCNRVTFSSTSVIIVIAAISLFQLSSVSCLNIGQEKNVDVSDVSFLHIQLSFGVESTNELTFECCIINEI